MRDDEYGADQLPSYGAVGQPAAVARLGRHLRTVRLGQAAATFALVTSVLALVFYGDGWAGTGRGWYIALIALAALLSVACTIQLLAWLQAGASWRGSGRLNARQLRSATFGVQIVSYVVVGLALVVGVIAIVEAGWHANAAILVVVTLVLMCVALVTAGVQYVHRSGPPGAAPSHMNKAVRRQNARRP